MTSRTSPNFEERILILAPTGSDASLMCRVLRESRMEASACATATELCRQVGEGAAVAIIADEALTDEALECLSAMLADQPEWSDFPLIVMTARREENGRIWSLLERLNGSAHLLLLERPVSTVTLTRAVRSVLQSRIRQYQLRDQIAERVRLEGELRLNVDELAESDRRKEQFLAVLGHELRNPLAAIVNGVRVLPMLGPLEDEAATVCDLLGRQTEQMTHLIDDLLDVSRISRGSVRLQVERLDLVPMIRDVAEEHRGLIEESGCTLEVDVLDTLPVEGDPTRLRQVLGNLLHNACKFTDPGGRITVAARRDAEGRSATVAVRDTGIGMSKESQEKLFQPFNQVESSVDRSRGGLGLGLALVKGLVELHGGAVSAHSSGLGRGSEFTAHLPLAAKKFEAPTESAPETSRGPHRAFRILLVEDSRPVAEIFSLILRKMGHEVEVAPSASAAFEQLPNCRPDIIFSDISMPGMSGYEFAQRIRQDPEWKDLIVVAVTGYGQPEDRARALQAGFDHHLVKPADIDRMQALFDDIAENHEPSADGNRGAPASR